LESVFEDARPSLERRLRGMLGGEEPAQDVLQEAFLRAWQRAPAGASRELLAAWIIRTATNLALDELRRRRRRPEASLEIAEHLAPTPEEHDLARDVLRRLGAQERFILLMRFEAGLTAAELGELLCISETAARKRIQRARNRFRRQFAAVRDDRRSLRIVVIAQPHIQANYCRWLDGAGARVRVVERASLRDVVYADGVVVGSRDEDVHPGAYGQRVERPLQGRPDARLDQADLAVTRVALHERVPVLNVCTGHQLLNVLSGGSLHQDLASNDARHASHTEQDEHPLELAVGSTLRAVMGARAVVDTCHHQAIRRLGSHLRVVAAAPDGVVEAVERTDREFAIGIQWRPELAPDAPRNQRLAQVLVEHAAGRAA
jgi:putative glutamine amidotransferase